MTTRETAGYHLHSHSGLFSVLCVSLGMFESLCSYFGSLIKKKNHEGNFSFWCVLTCPGCTLPLTLWQLGKTSAHPDGRMDGLTDMLINTFLNFDSFSGGDVDK